MADIIFLNGTSSSGKTTIAKCIQKTSLDRYFHLSVDSFCHMIDVKFFEEEYFMSSVNIAVSVMNRMAQHLCNCSEGVIIDTVIEDPCIDWLKECLDLFEGYRVTFVKVFCDENDLEERERQRGDRTVGMAIAQLDHMKLIQDYDIRVNTSKLSGDECAKEILENLVSDDDESAFEKLRIKLNAP